MDKFHKIIIIISAAVVVVAASSGFFAGVKYQESRRAAIVRQFAGGQGFGSRGFMTGNGSRAGIRPVSGEIIGSDDKSITIKLADGSTKIVLVSETTLINKASQATRSELVTGGTVLVFGQESSSGIVTAQNIQLNPSSPMKTPTGF